MSTRNTCKLCNSKRFISIILILIFNGVYLLRTCFPGGLYFGACVVGLKVSGQVQVFDKKNH